MVQIPLKGKTHSVTNGSRPMETFTMRTKDKERTYSVKMGFLYGVVSMALLWWIPVIGPFYSGYISGRKAGNTRDALTVSLVMSSLIIFTSIYLMATQVQATSFVGYYLKDGVYAFSVQPIAAASNLAVYTETFYGQITTLSLIVPSSLVIFNATSMLGGSVSSTINEEIRKPVSVQPQFTTFPTGYSEVARGSGTRGTMGTRSINSYNEETESLKEAYYDRL